MESQGTSSTGMSSNVAAGISYILGLITGVIFFVIEKEDKFVRFHAMQSILLSVAWIVVPIVLGIIGAIFAVIPGVGDILWLLVNLVTWVVYLGGFVLWLICLIRAFQGVKFKLPYLGDMAEKYA